MLVGILSCALCAVSCGERTESAVKTEYSIMKVSTADKVLTSSYSASIRGRQDINIYPQVSGTIQELCVSEGETVRAGQTLFVIDHDGRELLVPAREEFIRELDHEHRKMLLQLPDGLLHLDSVPAAEQEE